MNCKRFCGKTADFYCVDCLLKEIPVQRIMEELISRKLVTVQETVQEGKRKIQGYYIWKSGLEKQEKIRLQKASS